MEVRKKIPHWHHPQHVAGHGEDITRVGEKFDVRVIFQFTQA